MLLMRRFEERTGQLYTMQKIKGFCHLYNGQEAIDFLRENTVDLVFMDIEMPVLNGVEATKQIRKELKLASLPIIALTANTMQNQLDSYLEIGMSDIIIKPYMESCLFTIIQKYVN